MGCASWVKRLWICYKIIFLKRDFKPISIHAEIGWVENWCVWILVQKPSDKVSDCLSIVFLIKSTNSTNLVPDSSAGEQHRSCAQARHKGSSNLMQWLEASWSCNSQVLDEPYIEKNRENVSNHVLQSPLILPIVIVSKRLSPFQNNYRKQNVLRV